MIPPDAGAAACRILELDPARVRSLGFTVEAYGVSLVTVELVVDDETLRRLLAELADRAGVLPRVLPNGANR